MNKTPLSNPQKPPAAAPIRMSASMRMYLRDVGASPDEIEKIDATFTIEESLTGDQTESAAAGILRAHRNLSAAAPLPRNMRDALYRVGATATHVEAIEKQMDMFMSAESRDLEAFEEDHLAAEWLFAYSGDSRERIEERLVLLNAPAQEPAQALAAPTVPAAGSSAPLPPQIKSDAPSEPVTTAVNGVARVIAPAEADKARQQQFLFEEPATAASPAVKLPISFGGIETDEYVARPQTQEDWYLKSKARAPSPFDNRPENDVPSAGVILRKMADTFDERQKLYGSNFRMVGPILSEMFPDGVSADLIGSEQFHSFVLIVVKLSRFAFSGLQHQDSIHDAGVYCAMIEAGLAEKEQ